MKPRNLGNRYNPSPGKQERFWRRKAGEPDETTQTPVGASLEALEAKLAAIDAEHAAKWPVALHLF